jgi:hypothetical protein
MTPMRYALLALAVIVLLGVGRVYEWRGSEDIDVPAIELRSEQPVRDKASERPAVKKKGRSDRDPEVRSSEGAGRASPAPAAMPLPAGDDDDTDDGAGDDGGDE